MIKKIYSSKIRGVLRGVQPLLEYTPLPSPDGRKGGQASNEDLFPLGLGVRGRARVRVNQIKNS
jgi:hypothetical protein